MTWVRTREPLQPYVIVRLIRIAFQRQQGLCRFCLQLHFPDRVAMRRRLQIAFISIDRFRQCQDSLFDRRQFPAFRVRVCCDLRRR